eukprot:CAMPEP_0117440612 /NCGR_PEP_ID=MMETSP0759-20121206/3188_1 /TAXON_ID=63605 /ORGANISM="Percolomonas cosmopolitus, Strain WS" /LENGTH=278 /DNA_ID=CAMNT_0005232399 /DNA_START=74 /DNA_END=910 /DNA_ORIENTATION=-
MSLSAPNSDIDLRFIYVENLDFYLKVHQAMAHGRTKAVDMHGEVRYKIPEQESPLGIEIDMVGYELRRTLNLIAESNPTIFEWLRSGNVEYSYGKTHEELMKLMQKALCKRKLAMYFFETARSNLLSYILGNQKQKELVNRKKYIYVMRNLFNVIYMQKYDLDIPPMDFEVLLEKVVPLFPDDVDKERSIQEEIRELIRRKRAVAGQWEKQERVAILDEWILSVKEPLKKFAVKIPVRDRSGWNWDEMDTYFRNIVLKQYEQLPESFEKIVEVYTLDR